MSHFNTELKNSTLSISQARTHTHSRIYRKILVSKFNTKSPNKVLLLLRTCHIYKKTKENFPSRRNDLLVIAHNFFLYLLFSNSWCIKIYSESGWSAAAATLIFFRWYIRSRRVFQNVLMDGHYLWHAAEATARYRYRLNQTPRTIHGMWSSTIDWPCQEAFNIFFL